MAKLMQMLQPLQSEYVDRRFDGTKEEYFKQLELSSTLYIGNLSFYTTEDQIYELFAKVGVVARVIIGLDRNTKTPCGFCFVIYHRRADALAAVKHLNGTKLDSRQLRVDIDPGFEEGRQFGRGRSGGQVRDEFRTDYDADRGGYGHVVAQQLAQQQLAMWQEVQAGAALGAGLLPGDAAIFFNQAQAAALPGVEQQAAAAAAEGAEGAEGAAAEEAGNEAGSNPRLRGRGAEADEDEDEGQVQKRKRQRLGAEAAGGQQAQEQEQQLEQEGEAGDAADMQATDAAAASEEFETIEEDAPADADADAAAAQQEDEGEGGDAE